MMGKYETPDYEVIDKKDDFELRRYEDFYIVEYNNQSDPDIDQGFKTLFNYISSENKENEKMSMTVPVIQEKTETNKKMAFVVPEKYWGEVPEPNDPNLTVERFNKGIFAAVQFSGKRSDTKETSMKKELNDWIEKKGLEKKSDFMIASYSGPFTLPPFRKNEIWARVGTIEKD
ncbi:MAG: SOUL family heme-binding protein [Alkalibacterium gilvum]